MSGIRSDPNLPEALNHRKCLVLYLTFPTWTWMGQENVSSGRRSGLESDLESEEHALSQTSSRKTMHDHTGTTATSALIYCIPRR